MTDRNRFLQPTLGLREGPQGTERLPREWDYTSGATLQRSEDRSPASPLLCKPSSNVQRRSCAQGSSPYLRLDSRLNTEEQYHCGSTRQWRSDLEPGGPAARSRRARLSRPSEAIQNDPSPAKASTTITSTITSTSSVRLIRQSAN